MSEQIYYLREDVYFEPLFNHWYAWSYLIPPVTGARHMVNTHRRIMNSFVKNYHLHILANKEKNMTGGEFLNCTSEQVEDIKFLIEDIDTKQKVLVELSKAVEELNQLMSEHTSGTSIDYLYPKVPQCLKGMVEIFMDLEHRPSYRFIEPLVYKSELYKPQLQSVSFGILSEDNERPFILSTPRLPDDKHLQLNLRFDSIILDRLFSSRYMPLSEEEINGIFEGVESRGGLNHWCLFTKEKSPYQPEKVTEGVKLEFIGHAGFLVETAEVAILIDPVIASRGKTHADEIFGYTQLPEKIDFICLTHSHQDHINLETLLQLRHKTNKILVPKNNGGSLADPSMRLMLKQLGFDVDEIDDLDEIDVPGGKIVGIPFLGEHGDLNIRTKSAWFIELLGKRIFFGADSSNPDNNLYQHLARDYGDLDLLAIGMECVGAPYTWLYGALHTQPVSKVIRNSRRLNGSDYEQAFPMVEAFRAKRLCIYALGMEPWYKYFMGIDYDDDSAQIRESGKLLEACQKINVPGEMLVGRKTIHFT
uniref:Polyketide synthase n=1 Tax=Rheinheimera sp. BAL341 TaxID=1708203 RepID=A0A486XNW8_9GAMM